MNSYVFLIIGLLRLPVSISLILTSQRWHTRFLCFIIVRGQRALSTHEDVVRSLCEVVEAWAEPMHPGEEDQGEDPVSLLAPLSCFSTGAPTTEDEWMWTAGKVLRKPFTAKVAFYSGIPPILRRMRLPHSKYFQTYDTHTANPAEAMTWFCVAQRKPVPVPEGMAKTLVRLLKTGSESQLHQRLRDCNILVSDEECAEAPWKFDVVMYSSLFNEFCLVWKIAKDCWWSEIVA